jgi:major membrane immunogen (membrane-anchored lipoprotein)
MNKPYIIKRKDPKISCFTISLLIILLTSSITRAQDLNTPDKIKMAAIHLYKDGDFEGKSRASYTDEPYWGIVKLKIENGVLKEVMFTIRDSNLHERFSKKYADHFKDNPEYIQQCRNDSKGVKTYPKELAKKQDVDQVDAISGATWSYNIFKASMKEALKNAYNDFDSIPSH